MNPQSFIYSKEAVLAKIQKLTLFDNSLLSFIFRNKDACEYLIRILMHNSSTGLPYDNGLHTTYINAAVDDGSEIARLMQYFKTASTEDNSHGILSHCINELKTGKGGSQAMDEFTREYYIEGKAEGEERASLAIAANLKKMKIMSDEAIAKATNLSLEQVQAITA